MAGEPIFGGYGDVVAVLDWGQSGGTYDSAGTVKSTNKLIVGGLQIDEGKVSLPEQDEAFSEIMGLRGQPVTIEGVIRAATNTLLNTVEREIETHIYGTIRQVDGTRLRTAASMAKAQPTKLTDKFGRVVGLRVILKQYDRLGPRKKGGAQMTGGSGAPSWQQFRLVFDVLQ
jgi:hypothetical protein